MEVLRSTFLCLAALAPIAPALADVIVVDDSGGADFTQIQPAIDAALDGDTILVKPGNYQGGFSVNKSLTLIGDAGSLPLITGELGVGSVSGTVVTLARLKVQGSGGRALMIFSGVQVRVVDCELIGANGTGTDFFGLPGQGASVAHGSGNVAFVGCSLRGGDGVSDLDCFDGGAGGGAIGLGIERGLLAVYECIIQGGRGGNGGELSGGGSPGIVLRGGNYTSQTFLFVARSNVHGGAGGDTICPDSGCPGNGSSGLHIFDSSHPSYPVPIGWVFDLMIGGGAAGESINGLGSPECNPANPGPQYSGLPPFQFSAQSLGFSIPAIAREGDFVTVTFTGPPGARVFVNDRLTTTFEALASWRGVLLAPFAPDGAPVREIKWGVIPSSGELKRTYHVPQLPPGEEAQTHFLQAYRIGANGITLGTFRTLTILDSAF